MPIANGIQVLKKNGVERYDPLNEKFDPNLHTALFEIPDGSKSPGTIAAVTKVQHGSDLGHHLFAPCSAFLLLCQ